MKVRHRITICCVSPGSVAEDLYACTTQVTDRGLAYEDVVVAVEALTRRPVFQDQLTQGLADRLHALVRTVGNHDDGRVETTIVCRPCVRQERGHLRRR